MVRRLGGFPLKQDHFGLSLMDSYNCDLMSIPYDFDYSGFVNALYAVPGEELGIKSVTDRYYLGLCREEEQYDAVIDYILGKKDEFLTIVNSCDYLSGSAKTFAVAYLEEFIKLAESGRLKRYFRMTCR